MLVDDEMVFPTEAQMLRRAIAPPIRRAMMRTTSEADMHRVQTFSSLPESRRLLRELAQQPAPSEPEPSTHSCSFDALMFSRDSSAQSPQLPPPGATSKRCGGATRSEKQIATQEKLRVAARQRMDEEAPEVGVLAPLRAHARAAAGQPAASGLSAWAQRREVLAAEPLRTKPLSFEEKMALELQGLNLRASSAGWQRTVGDEQVGEFESRHRAAARRGLQLLGTGRLGRIGPSGGGDLLLPSTLAQSEFEAALDVLRRNRIHTGSSEGVSQRGGTYVAALALPAIALLAFSH